MSSCKFCFTLLLLQLGQSVLFPFRSVTGVRSSWELAKRLSFCFRLLRVVVVDVVKLRMVPIASGPCFLVVWSLHACAVPSPVFFSSFLSIFFMSITQRRFSLHAWYFYATPRVDLCAVFCSSTRSCLRSPCSVCVTWPIYTTQWCPGLSVNRSIVVRVRHGTRTGTRIGT